MPEEAHAPSVANGSTEIQVGLRLRHARMTRGLRLRELAELVGCSESLLSKVENEKVAPSLGMLHRVAEKLGLTVGQLFAKANEVPEVVSRQGERPVVMLDPLRSGRGLQFERLVSHTEGHLLQGSIHTMQPGAASDHMINHAGEEVGYVLEGCFELLLGDQTYILNKGDSYCFRSEVAHGYRNPNAVPARVIIINTPPSF